MQRLSLASWCFGLNSSLFNDSYEELSVSKRLLNTVWIILAWRRKPVKDWQKWDTRKHCIGSDVLKDVSELADSIVRYHLCADSDQQDKVGVGGGKGKNICCDRNHLRSFRVSLRQISDKQTFLSHHNHTYSLCWLYILNCYKNILKILAKKKEKDNSRAHMLFCLYKLFP